MLDIYQVNLIKAMSLIKNKKCLPEWVGIFLLSIDIRSGRSIDFMIYSDKITKQNKTGSKLERRLNDQRQ